MKRVLLSLTLLLAGFGLSQAQSTLSPGDVAIVGVASDNPDEFSILFTVDVLSGTELSFTDNGWVSGTSSFRVGEDTLVWRTNINLPAGTMVTFNNDNSSTATEVNIGEILSGKLNGLSSSGDQIFVFQGTFSSPSLIFGINFDNADWASDATSSNNSALPAVLTSGSSAVAVPEDDNMLYMSDSIGSRIILLTKICNPLNWTISGNRTDFDPSENARQEFLLATANPFIRNSSLTFNGDFGQASTNMPTAGSSFFVVGSNLTNDIVVTVGAPFEVRVGAGTYGSSVNIAPTSGTVNPTAVEVRFNPTAGGSFSDTVQITSNGAFTNQLLVKGEGVANPIVSFVTTSGSFDEGGANAMIEIEVLNRGSNVVTVDLTSKPMQTALEGLHFMYTVGPQIIFDGSIPDKVSVEVSFPDDNMSGPSLRTNKIGLMLMGADPGTNDSFSISIKENDYKVATIAEVKQLDADFLPLSFDSLFQVTGVVYGTNTRNTGGYAFTIIDGTAGISNFAPSSASDFGYTITEGDSIMMRGRLTHFNGLIQMDFLDTIKLLKANTPLKTPMLVNTVSEVSENEFVRINNVAFVTPTPTWSVSGSGSNYKVYNTVTMDTFEVRVIPTSGLANEPAPTGLFDIIGLGGQFDNSNPRNSGYQLFPRYAADVIVDELGTFDLLSPSNNSTITLQGDPTQTVDIVWSSSSALNGGAAPSYTFMLDMPTGDFSAPLLSVSAGTDTMTTFTFKQLADAFTASLPVGGSLSLAWTVKADNGSQEEWAQSTYLITFERSALDGLVSATQIARIFPNPANGVVHVQLEAAADQMTLIDMTGKVVYTNLQPTSNQEINISALNNGVYILQIAQNGKMYQTRVVVSNK